MRNMEHREMVAWPEKFSEDLGNIRQCFANLSDTDHARVDDIFRQLARA